ncbi:hypothetical protein DFJ43DRAFT_786632 [Lentinula guzmanii]|uniref:Secreted protein n=1 Tax=Lentinula guzmanii TaxID=2804957 RepID=A0AA38J3U4_9AGAR|nr:hypothetical protein DFJ43DRAFT_786632 [Lentinula guzmanii]
MNDSDSNYFSTMSILVGLLCTTLPAGTYAEKSSISNTNFRGRSVSRLMKLYQLKQLGVMANEVHPWHRPLFLHALPVNLLKFRLALISLGLVQKRANSE